MKTSRVDREWLSHQAAVEWSGNVIRFGQLVPACPLCFHDEIEGHEDNDPCPYTDLYAAGYLPGAEETRP